MKKGGIKEILIATKFGKFLCLFEPNSPDKGFTVTSPEAPGFVAYGKSLKEAEKTAKESLEFHCECVCFEKAGDFRPKELAVR